VELTKSFVGKAVQSTTLLLLFSLRLGLRLKTYLNCFRSVLNCCILKLSTPSNHESHSFVFFAPHFFTFDVL